MTNKLSHIFECSDHITEKQYRTSRALFILDGCASTQIFTVIFRRIFIGTCLSCGFAGDVTDRMHSCTADAD